MVPGRTQGSCGGEAVTDGLRFIVDNKTAQMAACCVSVGRIACWCVCLCTDLLMVLFLLTVDSKHYTMVQQYSVSVQTVAVQERRCQSFDVLEGCCCTLIGVEGLPRATLNAPSLTGRPCYCLDAISW